MHQMETDRSVRKSIGAGIIVSIFEVWIIILAITSAIVIGPDDGVRAGFAALIVLLSVCPTCCLAHYYKTDKSSTWWLCTLVIAGGMQTIIAVYLSSEPLIHGPMLGIVILAAVKFISCIAMAQISCERSAPSEELPLHGNDWPAAATPVYETFPTANEQEAHAANSGSPFS
jgi:hypothetical protein